MSTTATTIALTYNGADIQNLDGLFLEITSGLDDSPTSVRGVDVTVPGIDGQTPRPRRFHERRIILTGYVRGTGATQTDRRADYRVNVRAMHNLFPTGGGAAVEPEDLVVYLEDGDTATIAARCLNIVADNAIPSEFTRISIELLAVEDWDYESPGS